LLAEVVERRRGIDLDLRIGLERGLERGERLRSSSRTVTAARLEPRRYVSATAVASAQISDSIESPDANTPATCHGWEPSLTSAPGVRPANWRAAPRPTISSRSPA
jgi:hypothetical protein